MKRQHSILTIAKGILLIVLCLHVAAFTGADGPARCIYETEKSTRSSFCLYNDGRFYRAEPSGCVGQDFSWGYWERAGDSLTLNFSKENIFHCNTHVSADTQSKVQIVSVIDFPGYKYR